MHDAAAPQLTIGRDAELALIGRHLDAAAAGRGSIVVLRGEPGVGKTRVLEAALADARAAGFQAVVAANYEHARTPFGPVVDICAGLAAHVPSIVPAAASDLATYNRFLGVTPADRAAPPLDKRRLFVILSDAFERAAQKKPLAIGVDDAQWCDPESLELLHFLAPRLDRLRVVVVMTVRDERGTTSAAHAQLSEFERYPSTVSIALPSFSDEATRALIASALPPRRSLDAALLEEICRRADGNPLFVRELLREALHDDRPALLPASVHLATQRRMRTLDDRATGVTETASAVGRTFRVDDIAALTGTSRGGVLDALRAARDAGFVVEIGHRGETFAFTHELVRASVYGDMLVATRAALHRRIAEYFERGTSVAASDAVLAHHWVLAGERRKAATYAERAGDAAMELNANASARDRFCDALASGVLDAAEKARVEAKLSRAFGLLGDVTNAAGYAGSAARFYRSTGDDDTAAKLELRFANAAYKAGRGNEAIEACESVLRGTISADVRFGANALLATCRSYRNELDPARRAIEAADASGAGADAADAVSLEWARVMVAVQAGDEGWLPAAERAVEIAEASGDPGILAPTLLNVAAVSDERGRADLSAGALDRAIAVADEYGRTFMSAYARCSRAEALHRAGRLDEAYRTMLEVAALHVDALVVRIFAATVGLALFADMDREGTIPAFGDPDLLETAFATGEGARFAGLAAAHVHAAGLRGDRERARALTARTLGAMTSAAYASAALATFARFGTPEDVERALQLMGAVPTAGPPRIARLLIEAYAARSREDARALSVAAAVAIDAARRAAMPLAEAEGLELAGDRAAALEIYRSVGAHGRSRRFESRSGVKLTPRETEIAALVAIGLSNRAIAERLVLSERTIEHHVASMYAKLGVRSRSEFLISRASGRSPADAAP